MEASFSFGKSRGHFTHIRGFQVSEVGLSFSQNDTLRSLRDKIMFLL